MAKIIPRILGGLGNQLFSYAAARRLALHCGDELVIDDVSGFVYDKEYQRHYQLDHFSIKCRKATDRERLEPFSRLRRYAMRRFSSFQAFEDRAYIQQETIDFDKRLLHIKPRGTVYLEGYWQGEGYFKDVEDTIRADLQIQSPSDTANLEMATRICNSLSVMVHLRFFDAPVEAGVNNAPDDYYARAIEHMEHSEPGAHYFVFSDRPDAARTRIPLPDERVTVVSHNCGDKYAYADLWLMSQCRHFIIANSTFSWWGAWLARHPGKRVIAPGIEIRKGKMWWGFTGLLPDEWMKL